MLLALLLACSLPETPVLVESPVLVETPPAVPEPSLGPPFPYDYVPRDLKGEKASFSQWVGQPVLVNLWATWCGPCIQELPALGALHGEWAPKGLVMLGVAVEDFPPKVEATAKERGMAWVMLQDGAATTSKAFGADTLPVTLVYGKDGRLLYKHLGVVTAEDATLRAALEAAVR